GAGDREPRLAAHPRAVSVDERLAVERHGAPRDLDPGGAVLAEGVAHPLARLEQSRVDPGVGIYRHRATRAVARGDEAEPAALLPVGEVLLPVAGPEPLPLGRTPHLPQLPGPCPRSVVLACPHA